MIWGTVKGEAKRESVVKGMDKVMKKMDKRKRKAATVVSDLEDAEYGSPAKQMMKSSVPGEVKVAKVDLTASAAAGGNVSQSAAGTSSQPPAGLNQSSLNLSQSYVPFNNVT